MLLFDVVIEIEGMDKTTVYTIGRMGDHRVLSFKLRKVPTSGGTKPSHANAISQLIGQLLDSAAGLYRTMCPATILYAAASYAVVL